MFFHSDFLEDQKIFKDKRNNDNFKDYFLNVIEYKNPNFYGNGKTEGEGIEYKIIFISGKKYHNIKAHFSYSHFSYEGTKMMSVKVELIKPNGENWSCV
jgi:hypothetical protein